MNKTIYGDYIITEEQFSKLNFTVTGADHSSEQCAFIEDENGKLIQLNVIREVEQGFRDTRPLNFVVVSTNESDGFLTLICGDDLEKEMNALGYKSFLDISLTEFDGQFDPEGD